MKRLHHFLRILTEIRPLRLSGAGTLTVLGSYYLPRLPLVRRWMRGRLLTVEVRERDKKLRLLLRPNCADYKLLYEVFVERPYEASGNIRTILDLGGNIGVASCFLAARHPDATIAAVEPDPSNLAVLREVTRRNGLRVRVFDAAIGPRAGEAVFSSREDPRSSSLIPVADSEGSVALRVRQVTVPSIMEEMKWERVDLLKIDVEGYESVLFAEDNAWLANVGTICGEVHAHVHYGLPELMRDLGPFGFSVKITDQHPGAASFVAVRQ